MRTHKGHGIHSPFVYNLITRVVEETLPYYAFEVIENFREELLARGDALSKITDKEAATALYGALMFRLVTCFKCKTVLETGASTGIASLYLASARPTECECYIQEERTELLQPMRAFAKSQHWHNLHFNRSSTVGAWDMIVVHKLPAGMTIEQFVPTISENTLVVVDNIYKQPEMKQLWQTLCGQASTCLDLKHIGLAFFNPRLPKKLYKSYWRDKESAYAPIWK
ncbi:hypothetical protein AGMMS49965_09850 [Bacteroidia bacterium]|nr:hypothetical protein AGMMS49965_09850 [Bacteroidia bacterium]